MRKFCFISFFPTRLSYEFTPVFKNLVAKLRNEDKFHEDPLSADFEDELAEDDQEANMNGKCKIYEPRAYEMIPWNKFDKKSQLKKKFFKYC